MWLDASLDPLTLVPQPPIDLDAGDNDISPGERLPQPLHRLDGCRADLNLLVATHLQHQQQERTESFPV